MKGKMEENEMSGFKIMDEMLTLTVNISHGLSNLIQCCKYYSLFTSILTHLISFFQFLNIVSLIIFKKRCMGPNVDLTLFSFINGLKLILQM